jgi:hypothetical protein
MMADDDSRAVPAAGKFETLADYRSAVHEAISHARRIVRIFDRDLEDGGYNSLERFDLLRAFLLRSRATQVQIALHDVDYVQRHCPRLLILLQQFSHSVSIHQTTPEAREVSDGLVISDDAHFVHRFHFEHARGEWVLNGLARTQPWLRRFEEIWHVSVPAVSATTLGL